MIGHKSKPKPMFPLPTDDTPLHRAARLGTPGAAWCLRCGVPTTLVEYHSTYYTECSGCSPLCEACWSSLTVDERVPYYMRLVDNWQAWEDFDSRFADNTAQKRELIRAAVEAGG